MSSDRVWDFIRRWQLPPEVSHVMAEIWPARADVARPTSARALNDSGLALLSMQFFDEMRLLTVSEGRSS